MIVTRLGRVQTVRGPGTCFVFPLVDQTTKLDMRISTFETPALQIVTVDRGLVELAVVVFSRIADPMAAHCGIQNRDATLRSLSYNIIYNYLVKKKIYELTLPETLEMYLNKSQVFFHLL